MSAASRGVSRREFLKAGAVSAAALGLTGVGGLVAVAAAKKRIPISLQLYSVRDDCDKDLPKVLEAVAKMGYEGVEFAGYYKRKADELRKMLDSNGLKCSGTHTGMGELEGDRLKATVEFHKTLGAKFITVPGGVGGDTKQSWLDAAKKFNEAAERLKEFDMYTGYHNHSHEFKKVDGETFWDILFSNTSDRVCQQIDTGNMMGGGGDPVFFLKKYPGRSLTIHLKEHGDGDFGAGTCPWKEVFEICETTGGTQWYVIEQEAYKQGTPIECVAQCIDFMRKMGKAKA